MCDECTWHHKAFLRQLYWHLAIKLLYYIAGEPDVLTGIALCLCLCPSFSVSLSVSVLGIKCQFIITLSLPLFISACLSVCLSVCLCLPLPASLSLSHFLSFSYVHAQTHSVCDCWGDWMCVGLGVCMCSCMTGCGKGGDKLLTWAFWVTHSESACIVIVSFSLADSL